MIRKRESKRNKSPSDLQLDNLDLVHFSVGLKVGLQYIYILADTLIQSNLQ